MDWRFLRHWRQLGAFAKNNQWQLMLIGTVASLLGLSGSFGSSDPVAAPPHPVASAATTSAPDLLPRDSEVSLSFDLNDDAGADNIKAIDFLKANVGREVQLRVSLYQRGNAASDMGFQQACKQRHKSQKIRTIFDRDFIGNPIAVNLQDFDDTENVPAPDDCDTLLVITTKQPVTSQLHDTVYDQNIVLAGLFRIRLEGMTGANETFFLEEIPISHVRIH